MVLKTSTSDFGNMTASIGFVCSPATRGFVISITHLRFSSRKHLGQPAWDDYFKFAFERNPWDKAVSIYWYRNAAKENAPPISEYVASGWANDVKGFDLYSIRNRIAVDRIFRYEEMRESLRSYRRGLDSLKFHRYQGPRANTDRISGITAKSLMTPPDLQITRAYPREIAHLGYRF